MGRALGAACDAARSTSYQAHKMTLVFVNTRSQAEMIFQELWRINDDGLPIALHHGSLDVAQRRKVEAAMAAGELRARGLHLDARSRHRLGRCRSRDPDRRAQGRGAAGAAHRPRQPPAGRAVARRCCVPANRFEVLECEAALEAVAEGAQDHAEPRARARSTCWPSTSWAGLRRAVRSDRASTTRSAAPGPIAA